MLRDVGRILGDRERSWDARLARLQGWRGAEAEEASTARTAQRLGPAVCAVGALVGALLGSPPILAIFAVTALIGAVAPNHPLERLYNAWAGRNGRPCLPANRAARRLGCAIGFVFLAGAAVAFAAGASVLGFVLALVIAVTAAFVATSRICVPSMLFTVIWGAEKATRPTLPAAIVDRPAREREPHGSARG